MDCEAFTLLLDHSNSTQAGKAKCIAVNARNYRHGKSIVSTLHGRRVVMKQRLIAEGEVKAMTGKNVDSMTLDGLDRISKKKAKHHHF